MPAKFGMPGKSEFLSDLDSETEVDFQRIYYCFYLGNVFVQLQLMEQTIIDALQSCSKLDDVVGIDVVDAESWTEKKGRLVGSTLGSLVKYLERAGVHGQGLKYLRFLKRNRDHFVHRFFIDNPWPGELAPSIADQQIRRLRYLEYVFARGGSRIWSVMAQSGLFEILYRGQEGVLLCNESLFDRIEENSKQ